MLLVTFVALSLLANLRTMLKRKLPAHENIRAVDCDIMDFNEEYTLSDYYTISERERQKFCVPGIIGARQSGASNEHEYQTQFS